jgi:predicted signal transduction protein with EAL and GGDEF domain
MIEYITLKVFLFSTQVLVFSILLFIFFIYYKTFSRQYVKYWLASVSALTLSYLIKACSIYPSTKLSFEAWYIAAEFCLHLGQYLFVSFLILGVLHAKNKVVNSKLKWASCLLIVALSLLSTLLFSFDSKHAFNHFYLSVSLPSFISGCAFFALASFLVIDKERYFSSRMLMLFSAIFGFRFLIHSFISIVALTEYWFRQLELFLIFFDAAAHVILGFVLLIWMQGAERYAALSAINRAKYLGKHDSLTGALNREQVMAKLASHITQIDQVPNENIKTKLAVFLIDIKQFKFINDTYGLKIGDYVLGEIAKRLSDSVFFSSSRRPIKW